MVLDFNNEEQQRSAHTGPVPSGSRVLVELSLEKPKHSAVNMPYISETKGGLLGLWVKYTVSAGSYEGCSWYENLWLPKGQQAVRLTDGQVTACNIAGRKLRAIVEAARNIDPKSTESRAVRGRQLADWFDLNGMQFPVIVGIDSEPFENKYGKTCWSNTLYAVVTPDKKEYAELMRGGEIITDGPVAGSDSRPRKNIPAGGGTGMPWDEPGANDPGPAFPSESSMDEVPF